MEGEVGQSVVWRGDVKLGDSKYDNAKWAEVKCGDANKRRGGSNGRNANGVEKEEGGKGEDKIQMTA